MAIPIQTELFYQKVIDRVIQAMKVPVLNEGHSVEVLRTIRQKWERHLRQSVRYAKRREQAAPPIEPDPTPSVEQKPAVEANQSDSDPDDPEVAALFRQYKRNESQQQTEPPVDHDSIPSDEDTNLIAPAADVELMGTCDRVVRKQTTWRIKLRHCIIESAAQNHHVIDRLDGNLKFIQE